MGTQTPKNILVAPLDWGLGHTTRCVPIIRHLQQLGHNPIVAGNASQLSFISQTFSNAVNTVHLDGYNITYSQWNRVAQMGLLSQMPSVALAISSEQRWLEQKARELHLHGVISDNRYGLHHDTIPSVIITHQLQVLSGLGGIADVAIQKLHYKFLERFNAVWVADAPGALNLGGRLSHPAVLPKNTQYIGLLSRFDKQPAGENTVSKRPTVILLSGPEPQRGELAQMLWQQATQAILPVIFIEGTEAAIRPPDIPAHINWYARLTDEQLASILPGAGMVICRSGYSTIMDLVALGKKAILIPTPGQTEQQYLAEHLHKQGAFYTSKQDGFNLQQAIAASKQFPYHNLALQNAYGRYKAVADKWIPSL